MARNSPAYANARANSELGFEDQTWPVNCAIFVLAGLTAGLVIPCFDFDESRLLYNGYTYIVLIGTLAAALVFMSGWLKGALRRRFQLCVLLSLSLHVSVAIAAKWNPFSLPLMPDTVVIGGGSDQPEEEVVVPDYHWVQAEESQPVQSFQTPVQTKLKDEQPPAAQVEPRNLDRPVPIAEIPQAPKPDITPLGSSGPGGPIEMRRAEAAAIPAPKTDQVVAMNFERNRKLDMPKLDAEVPVPAPDIPKPVPDAIQPEASSTAKVESSRSTEKAAGAEPAAPRLMARTSSQSGPPLPAMNIMAQLPSESLPKLSDTRRDLDGAAALSKDPSTLARSDRDGRNLPSNVLPDQGELAQAPAAVGGSIGTRLDPTSTVAVERSSVSRAPLGPTVAAAGIHEVGIGGNLLESRIGSPEGHGAGRPSTVAFSSDDPTNLRSGSVDSFSDRGAPLPSAAARRAIASQLHDGAPGMSPNESATLARTRTNGGLDIPSATLPTENVPVAGAGGVAPSPGGATSKLDVAADIAVRHTFSTLVPRPDAVGGLAARGEGPVLSDTMSATNLVTDHGPAVAIVGPASGVRNVELQDRRSDPTMTSVPRAASGPINPDTNAEAAADQNRAPSGIVKAPVRTDGVASGLGTGPLGPGQDADLNRLGEPGQRAGTPARHDLPELGNLASVLSPEPTGRGTRHGLGMGDPTQLAMSSGLGRGNIGRSTSGLDIDGTVREPTEFYRRRSLMHRGLGPGEGDGSGFTERAVEIGLDFFSKTQFPDGHWSLDQAPPGVDPAVMALGSMQSDTAGTGLCLLSYLGAGYTHLDEKHRDVVRRGIEWLVNHQKPDGDLYTGGSSATHFYSQGIAAMALCEAYGMTQDPDLRQPAQKAVRYILASQDLRRGGWRYEPGQESDTSVTGWQLMALKSAQMSGLDVPNETFRKISGWLDRAQGPSSDGRYVYNPWNLDNDQQRDGRLPSPTMTAEAMLMRMYLGTRRDDRQLIRGAEYLKANLPEVGTREESQRNCYYWYYATQAMYEMGGDYWKVWNDRMGRLVKAGQVQDGPMKGSWHPTDPVPDRWGPAAGRIYVTSMHLLMLEVYYRHLPLFQELSK